MKKQYFYGGFVSGVDRLLEIKNYIFASHLSLDKRYYRVERSKEKFMKYIYI